MLACETYESNLRLGRADLCSIAHQRLLKGPITNCILHPEHLLDSFDKFRYDKFQKAI